MKEKFIPEVMKIRNTTKSLTWIKDKNGKEYVCFSRDVKKSKCFEDLSQKEKELCDDTSKLDCSAPR